MRADAHQGLVQLDTVPLTRAFVQHVGRERRDAILIDRVISGPNRNQ